MSNQSPSPALPGQLDSNEQVGRQSPARGALRAAAISLVLGLLSITLNIMPGYLVFPLREWVSIYVLMFVPFLSGLLAFIFGVVGLVRYRRVSWLAISGIAIGAIGMFLGSLIVAVCLSQLLAARGLELVQ